EYSVAWDYEHLEERSTAYGSSPAFNFAVVDEIVGSPGFEAAAPHGWWEHSVAASEGGVVGVGIEDKAGVNLIHQNGGLLNVAKAPAPDTGLGYTQHVAMCVFPAPGYELETWNLAGVSLTPIPLTY